MKEYIAVEKQTDNGGFIDIVSELIRCRDCKHSEPWYRDRRRCFLWDEGGISVWDDGFCNYAERKEHEID